ncbi:MAG TPA: hypothetical protein VFQ70_00985, partial [Candidatus Saccharimonadaceae bacterium]|nr:hypothetical protein [Candidatus Saccharimonadaceae bacterium]
AADHRLKVVIYLKASEQIVRKRWAASRESGGREARVDDEHLEVRLAEFNDKTLPVIDFYRDEGLLLEVDAEKSPQKVTNEILVKLTPLIETTKLSG